jgi:hypothetical protein
VTVFLIFQSIRRHSAVAKHCSHNVLKVFDKTTAPGTPSDHKTQITEHCSSSAQTGIGAAMITGKAATMELALRTNNKTETMYSSAAQLTSFLHALSSHTANMCTCYHLQEYLLLSLHPETHTGFAYQQPDSEQYKTLPESGSRVHSPSHKG